jgi:CTD kinase subunit gamma
MDSFEVATQFAQMLRTLTPSMPQLTKTAHFALKNSASEDYLFPSILDILRDGTAEINLKSIILQFIDILISESFYYSNQVNSNYNYPYVSNLKLNLPKILLTVLPHSNTSNLFVVYSCLNNISRHYNLAEIDGFRYQFQHGELLTDEDLANIDNDVPFPEVTIDESDNSDPLLVAWKLLIQKKKQCQYERRKLLKHSAVVTDVDIDEKAMFDIEDKQDKSVNLSKRQIIGRMEDHREAHKRSKETLWVVERPKDLVPISEEEFLHHYWNKYQRLDQEQNQVLLNSLEDLNKMVSTSYKDRQF